MGRDIGRWESKSAQQLLREIRVSINAGTAHCTVSLFFRVCTAVKEMSRGKEAYKISFSNVKNSWDLVDKINVPK